MDTLKEPERGAAATSSTWVKVSLLRLDWFPKGLADLKADS
jgi:hypothetical protein